MNVYRHFLIQLVLGCLFVVYPVEGQERTSISPTGTNTVTARLNRAQVKVTIRATRINSSHVLFPSEFIPGAKEVTIISKMEIAVMVRISLCLGLYSSMYSIHTKPRWNSRMVNSRFASLKLMRPTAHSFSCTSMRRRSPEGWSIANWNLTKQSRTHATRLRVLKINELGC